MEIPPDLLSMFVDSFGMLVFVLNAVFRLLKLKKIGSEEPIFSMKLVASYT